jgi:hypothetical protein
MECPVQLLRIDPAAKSSFHFGFYRDDEENA